MTARESARRAVESSAVLLKNEGGIAATARRERTGGSVWLGAVGCQCSPETALGQPGAGSSPSVVEALKDCWSFARWRNWSAWYRGAIKTDYNRANPPEVDFSKLKEAVNSGLMYELFGKYTPNPPEFLPLRMNLLDQAASQTDTALWILGSEVRRGGVRPPPGKRLLSCLSRSKLC